MILVVAFALCLGTVPLLGGRLSRLATIGVRRRWAILAALGLQILIFSVIPHRLPAGVGPALHLASYGLALAFVAANWRIPGMAILTLGGLANLVAIGANGGVMPASPAALERAGLGAAGEFVNSEAQDKAHLLILGDIFAIPAGLPLANVFSVGDVALVIGGAVLVHRAAGSRPPWCRQSAPDQVPEAEIQPEAGKPAGGEPTPTRLTALAGPEAGSPAGCEPRPEALTATAGPEAGSPAGGGLAATSVPVEPGGDRG